MAEFKSGEIVLLKCGGPEMVVDSADFDHVYCKWFAGKKIESSHFHPDTLLRVAPTNKPASDNKAVHIEQ